MHVARSDSALPGDGPEWSRAPLCSSVGIVLSVRLIFSELPTFETGICCSKRMRQRAFCPLTGGVRVFVCENLALYGAYTPENAKRSQACFYLTARHVRSSPGDHKLLLRRYFQPAMALRNPQRASGGQLLGNHAAPPTAIGESIGTSATPESRNARTHRYNQDARSLEVRTAHPLHVVVAAGIDPRMLLTYILAPHSLPTTGAHNQPLAAGVCTP
jgi:hypothetical protein